MKNEKLKRIKDKLIAKKRFIISQLKKFAKINRKVKNDFETKFPDVGDHKGENAIEVSNYEDNLSVEHTLEDELKKIGSALKKTSNGTYGVCSVCKNRISPKRLEIMPEATLCVKCSEKNRKM